MSQIKGIVFDFYGLFVIDSDRLLIERAEKVNPQLADELRDIMKQYDYGVVDYNYMVDSFRIKLGLSHEEIMDYFRSHKHLDTRLVELVHSLRQRGFKVGLLTNTGKEGIERYIDEQHLLQIFDDVVLSFEIGLIKPNPEIFTTTVRRLGVEAHTALMIDDRPENLDGARQAGLATLLFHNFDQCIADLAHILA